MEGASHLEELFEGLRHTLRGHTLSARSQVFSKYLLISGKAQSLTGQTRSPEALRRVSLKDTEVMEMPKACGAQTSPVPSTPLSPGLLCSWCTSELLGAPLPQVLRLCASWVLHCPGGCPLGPFFYIKELSHTSHPSWPP